MKKLVYMLSLAIGLSLTGCATWDVYDPMPADSWGDLSELTVIAPDTVTTSNLPITVITKNAANLSLLVSDTAMATIDYTILLQGGYDGCSATAVKSAGDTVDVNWSGVVAGNTYYLYVVSANSAGVQTTYSKTIGAVDIEAPYITSVFPLSATNKGHTVVIRFNEAISVGSGSVLYNVYDENLDVVNSGVVSDVNLVASGVNLTVTLPSTVEFVDDTDYYVVLSFEDGAIVDVYGNKMAAIDGSIDEEGLPHGPWWNVNNSSSQSTGFLTEGNYVWSFGLRNSSGTQNASTTTSFEYVGTADLSSWGSDYRGITADQWSVQDFLKGVLFTSSEPFAAFAYEMEGYNVVDMVDPSLEDLILVGYYLFDGDTESSPIYLATLEGQYLYSNVTFVYEQEVLYCLSEAVLVTPYNGQYSLVAYLDDIEITPEGKASVANAAGITAQIKKFDRVVARKATLLKKH